MNVSYDASYINAGTLLLRGCCVVVNAGNKVFSFFGGGGVVSVMGLQKMCVVLVPVMAGTWN